MADVMVSIICNTYNHEEYIEDAIRGFLAQKTTFLYEVLIHDDASTDATQQIIRKYQEEFPNVIKPIFQTINQYGKNSIIRGFQLPRAQGKYIALCEGDDYWVDENKLQKQVDYMETHDQCTFCFTNGLTLTTNGFIDHIIPWTRDCRRKPGKVDFNTGEIELLGYIPTASFLWRRKFDPHQISESAFKGDCYYKLSMTEYGYAHFIDENCVVYRRTNIKSETRKWERKGDYYAKICNRYISLFRDMKFITNHKYDDIFDYRITQWIIKKYIANSDCKSLRCLAKLGVLRRLKYSRSPTKIKILLLCLAPEFAFYIKRILPGEVFHKLLGNTKKT